jgi:hypothetical protein
MTFGTPLEASLTSYILVPHNQNNLKLLHQWGYFILGLEMMHDNRTLKNMQFSGINVEFEIT